MAAKSHKERGFSSDNGNEKNFDIENTFLLVFTLVMRVDVKMDLSYTQFEQVICPDVLKEVSVQKGVSSLTFEYTKHSSYF